MDGFKNTTKTKYMTEGGTFNERSRRATMSEIAAEDRRMARRPSEGVSSRPTDASGRRATDAELGMTTSAKKPVGPSSVAVSKVLAGMTKPMKKATGGSVIEKPQVSGGPVTDPRANIGNTLGKASATTAAQLPKPARPHPIYAIAARQKQQQDSGQDRHSLLKRAVISHRPVPPTRLVEKPASNSPAPTAIRELDERPGGPAYSPERVADANAILARPRTSQHMSEPFFTKLAKGGSAKKGVPAHSDRPMIGRKASGLAVMPKGKR